MGPRGRRRRRSAGWLIGIAVGAAATGWSPALAMAAETYFASPAGPAADPCSQASPCSLEYAVETKAVDGDEVVVLPGTYHLEASDLHISASINLHGVSPHQRPLIIADVPGVLTNAVIATAPGTQLRDLEIAHLGSNVALGGVSIVADRLLVHGEGGVTCALNDASVMRDSACFNHSNGDAISHSQSAGLDLRLVNVTAIAGVGAGLRAAALVDTPTAVVSATNVIARGGAVDIRATTGGAGQSATVVLDHSNYLTTATAGAGSEQITPAGMGTNQTAAPLFESGSGNFHQAAGSPTIDAGAANPADGGSLDLDGQPRALGASPDIGADEYPSAVSTGRVELLTRRARIKGGKVRLRLECGSIACDGNRVVLRRIKAGRAGPAAAKRRLPVLGKARFSLAANSKRKVAVRLSRRARDLVSRRGRLRARVVISGEGDIAAAEPTMLLLAPKRKPKR